MVNLVAAQKPLLHGLMKLAGIIPHTVEIEPGTVMNIWVPSETIKKPKKTKTFRRRGHSNRQAHEARCSSRPWLRRRGHRHLAIPGGIPDEKILRLRAGPPLLRRVDHR
ncbi:UNVERIFIED_CONTAM: hypothetical protein Slati_1550000 [Sesamum latifolium]|uniref:Uncharacterized protein n=1 Tax=Sesamum latifolium TaxID=2727402 RepID=A0AAW2XCQ0_9LAMI